MRLRQNGSHFPEDIFKCIFLNKNAWISIKISLQFVPKGPINHIQALVQIMASHRPGNKPLSEPMELSLLMHICRQVPTLPTWVSVTLVVWEPDCRLLPPRIHNRWEQIISVVSYKIISMFKFKIIKILQKYIPFIILTWNLYWVCILNDFVLWLIMSRNCYQVNATTHHWSLLNIGSGNGLVPSVSKPFPEPMLT